MNERGRQIFGIADFSFNSEVPGNIKDEAMYGVCTVDGKEIGNCFYIDTENGIVKTYSLSSFSGLPPGFEEDEHFLAHLSEKWPANIPLPAGIECEKDGVMWATLRGNVCLYAPTEERRARFVGMCYHSDK
jgi:hypothetical protein